jgi:hypothetical protein
MSVFEQGGYGIRVYWDIREGNGSPTRTHNTASIASGTRCLYDPFDHKMHMPHYFLRRQAGSRARTIGLALDAACAGARVLFFHFAGIVNVHARL